VDPFRGRDSPYTRNQLRGPGFQRLYQDIYIDSAVRPDHRDWCRAATLLLPPGGAVGMLSAAHLWGVRGLDPGPDVRVLVPPSASLRPQPHLVVRRAQLSADDITSLFGIPVTTSVRTAFDLARFLPRVDAVVALDAMLRQAKLSPAALLSYLTDHAWWPGVASARSAFSLADGLAESPMETRMRLVIVESDLPMPVAQFRIFSGKRFVARVDFAYEQYKLALEYDGDYHRERTTFRFDMERQREMFHLGWRVLRFNADDVLRFPDRMLAEIRAALRRS
jgi:Protein of unknown function (DUF559)